MILVDDRIEAIILLERLQRVDELLHRRERLRLLRTFGRIGHPAERNRRQDQNDADRHQQLKQCE